MFRSGWKDGFGMFGRYLCWSCRFGSYWIIKKIEIMGVVMKRICGMKKVNVRVLGSVRIYEDYVCKVG